MIDWIDNFVHMTATVRSPTIFRTWAAITVIAAALEHRVWTATDVKPLYPNLYTILVGHPAAGKSLAVVEARKVLGAIPEFKPGPDDPTKASFFDELHKATKPIGNGSMIQSCAMTQLCREFGVLFKPHDELYPYLTDLYDNPDNFTSPRRTSTSIVLDNPIVTILAGATPAAISELPERAWNDGFNSRVGFIWGNAPQGRRNAFAKRGPTDLDALKTRINEIYHDIYGEFVWEVEAQNAFDVWFNDKKMEPAPKHHRLFHYAARRDTRLMKLAMISAISSGKGLCVAHEDFLRAKRWLEESELVMPDVFRAMVQRSDAQILYETHYHAWVTWSNQPEKDRKPLTDKFFWEFLENKATSDKIPGLMRSLETGGRIKRAMGNGLWVPNHIDFNSIPV